MKNAKKKSRRKPKVKVVCYLCAASILHDDAFGLWFPYRGKPLFICMTHVPERCLKCDNVFRSTDESIKGLKAKKGCHFVESEQRCLECDGGLGDVAKKNS